MNISSAPICVGVAGLNEVKQASSATAEPAVSSIISISLASTLSAFPV